MIRSYSHCDMIQGSYWHCDHDPGNRNFVARIVLPHVVMPTFSCILTAAAPAILNNIASPLSVALQLVILGHAERAVAVTAAFAAVNAVTGFLSSGVANFLIVVAMARVSHALGGKEWAVLGATVRAALCAAAAVGTVGALVVWMLRSPLFELMSLRESESRDYAASFLPPALVRLPPLLILRTASGVLVGYQRLRLASVINASLAATDAALYYAIVGRGAPASLGCDHATLE